MELGCVWKYITGNNLNGAHDSLMDVKAQTDVITHEFFIGYFDKAKFNHLIEDILSKSVKSSTAKQLEPTHAVHTSWVELDHDSDFS